MRLSRLFAKPPERDAGEALFAAVAAQARRPRPYADWGVPDTFDGRFDMLVLHAFLVVNRLAGQGEQADAVAQALFDRMFATLDHTLREIGVGDMGIGRRIEAMASAFYGRCGAYGRALAQPDPGPLTEALSRNVWRGETPAGARPDALADYVRRTASALSEAPLPGLLAGHVRFPEP